MWTIKYPALGSTFCRLVVLIFAPTWPGPNEEKPGLFDRDGNEMSPKNVNAFVESWQKNDKDPQLFEIARIPQYPSSCLYVMNEKPTNSRKLKERSKVKMEDAIRVCAVHSAGPMRQFCIDDVFATGDLDSATFEFYGSKH